MRAIPETMAAALGSGASTLCRCWQVTRRDGLRLGFTDHDRDLDFDGLVHAAGSGLSAGALEVTAGLSVDSQQLTGALSGVAVSERDIELGLWDGAEVTALLVDWTDPEARFVVSVGTIGEIRRRGGTFEAEVVGLAESLNRPVGRAYVPTCDCRLGDAKCGVDLSDPTWRGEGSVAAIQPGSGVEVEGLGAFEAGLFDGGRLVWLSGGNAGSEAHVRRHSRFGERVWVDLWLTPPFPVQAGDGLAIEAGCDKTLATCRDRFANLLNFRGFPHMPGDDWSTGYPEDGGSHDGGSLYRT